MAMCEHEFFTYSGLAPGPSPWRWDGFIYLAVSSLKHCPCASLKSLWPLPHTYTKINSKWIEDVRPKTVKTGEENIGLNFYDLELGSGFFNMTPKTEATKST